MSTLFLLLCNSAVAQQQEDIFSKKDSSGDFRIPTTDSLKRVEDGLLKSLSSNSIGGGKNTHRTLIASWKELGLLKRSMLDTIPGMVPRNANGLKAQLRKFSPDSLRKRADSSLKKLWNGAAGYRPLPNTAKTGGSTSSDGIKEEPFFSTKPILTFRGGFVNYSYNYYSAIDTPFAEQKIGQHNLTGSAGFTVARALPFTVNFWIRRSNSLIYQDMTDVQVAFDPMAFRNGLKEQVERKLQALKPNVNDSLLAQLAKIRSMRVQAMENWLNFPMNVQQLHEKYEMLGVDSLHPETRPTDTAKIPSYQNQLKEAAEYIRVYTQTKKLYDSLSASLDTLNEFVRSQRERLEQTKHVLSGKGANWSNYSELIDSLKEYGASEIPSKYKWLMGVRNFSLGKAPLNYSELTAKNIRLGGINFEYNSWYYLAFSAGMVDYRFRDFVVGAQAHPHQYLVMLRAGIGRLEKNYLIVSLFKGRKQLYNQPSGSQVSNYIDITGVTVAAKWQLNRYSYFTTEVGQSLSPDYRSTPPTGAEKFTWSGGENKAFAVKLFSSYSKLDARLEGMYKYTGANYQSFTGFQTNAALTNWYLKWDQNLLKRKIRISAAVRSNEYTNPYIVQHYSSNTIFTSVNVVFKARKLPIVSIGYMPMSQLSAAGQQVVENRFQMLTVSLMHYYRLGHSQAYTTVMYNRFYNKVMDSAFIYFNANNFYLSQQIMFKLFTAGLNLADSRNSQYHLISGEMSVRVPLPHQTTVGFSTKINNLNQQETRIGGRLGLDWGISRKDRISMDYEKSWLPGTGRQLVPCDMGTVQYSRYF